ncbi:jacalin-like lectin [Undibacterium sp. Di27W]|uniref:jacalin-like lectin n=1 Tax=Undibacterium sp. Di27W TaxID=3413036 RepID=UPI003BF2F769
MHTWDDLIFDTETQGGPSGRPYRIVSNNKSAISKIETWETGQTIRGIKVYFRENPRQGYLVGTEDGEHHALELQDGEYIKSAKLGTSGYRGGRCGWIELHTNFGNSMKSGNWRNTQIDLSRTGTLLGIFGNAGSDVDSLGFVMMEAVKEVELSNISIDMKEGNLSSVDAVEWLELRNNSSVAQTCRQTWQASHTDTTTFTHTHSFSVGFKISVKGGVGIAEMGKEFSFSYTGAISFAQGHSETKTFTMEMSAIVPPNSVVFAKGVVSSATLDVHYKAKAVFRFVDETKPPFSFDDFRGVYLAVRGKKLEAEYLQPNTLPKLETAEVA